MVIRFVIFYGIIFVYCVLSTSQTTIHAPTNISALSDDVTVLLSNPVEGSVELLNADGQVVAGQMVTAAQEKVALVFDCGYFSRLGKYLFRFVPQVNDDVIAPSTTVNVISWPDVTVTWKEEHEALTTDVKVKVDLNGNLCTSDIARQINLSLKLFEYPSTDIDSFQSNGLLSDVINPVVKTTANVHLPPTSIIFPCEEFNQAGLYKAEVLMTSTSNDDVIVATSNAMNVQWSREYGLKVPNDVSNCHGNPVFILFSVPPCVSAYDVIAVHSYSGNTSRLIANQTIEFGDTVQFPCKVFRTNASVDGFCFYYVTSTGHVIRSVCQATATNNGTFNINGDWSSWSSWSTCNRPCLGVVKRRKRICDNPQPQGGGMECITSKSDSSMKEIESDIRLSTTCNYQSPMTSLITSSSALGDKCVCGCSLAGEMGIIASQLPNKCQSSNNLLWTVRAPPGHVIKFRLVDYQLADDETLSVRDGKISWPLTPRFLSITSKFNTVIIQLVTSQEKSFSSCGFVLYYETIVAPTRANPTLGGAISTTASPGDEDLAVGLKRWFQVTLAENPVLFGSITALVIVLLVVIVLVVAFHRKQRKKIRKQAFNGSESTSQRLSTPPDGRSCSTESEPMIRNIPGDSDHFEARSEMGSPRLASVKPGTAYYLAQRQLQLMKQMGQNQSTQMYATLGLSESIKDQEDLLFGGKPSNSRTDEIDQSNSSKDNVV